MALVPVLEIMMEANMIEKTSRKKQTQSLWVTVAQEVEQVVP